MKGGRKTIGGSPELQITELYETKRMVGNLT